MTALKKATGSLDRPSSRGWWLSGPVLTYLLGVLGVAIGIALWHWSVRYFEIPSYILPAPMKVADALISGLSISPLDRSGYLYHLIDTLQASFVGFALGSIVALLLAIIITEFPLTENFILPYMVGLQSLPKVAIVPLIIIWFGYGQTSKIVMTFVLVLFPVLINSLEGLRSSTREQHELLRSLRANRWQAFRYVKFPNALPHIFTGLNLGVVYALLGTLVAELVGGAQKGMGVIIMQLQTVADIAGVFAALVILAVVGYLLNTAVRLIQNRVVFWVGPGERR